MIELEQLAVMRSTRARLKIMIILQMKTADSEGLLDAQAFDRPARRFGEDHGRDEGGPKFRKFTNYIRFSAGGHPGRVLIDVEFLLVAAHRE